MTNSLNIQEITNYVEANIDKFHGKRLEKLENLNFKQILKRKNPYLYKAKNILTAQDFIKRNIVFDQKAFKQFNQWVSEDRKLYQKIVQLIDDTLRHLFSGIGKPEPLKHTFKGYWSRKINDEHRLIYKVTETEIIIISCKFHYD